MRLSPNFIHIERGEAAQYELHTINVRVRNLLVVFGVLVRKLVV
jgi:hypothetical protein